MIAAVCYFVGFFFKYFIKLFPSLFFVATLIKVLHKCLVLLVCSKLKIKECNITNMFLCVVYFMRIHRQS